MLNILLLKAEILLVQFNLILSLQSPQKLWQGVCGFPWGVVFSYLNMPAWMCPCSEKFSSVKSMLWLILWGCGITALKPPS